MTAELPAELLDAIRNAWVDLNLQPDGDPAQALLDWIKERGPRREKVQAENEEIVRLADRLNTTVAALDAKKRALRETEEALGAAGAALEKARGAAAADSHETDASATFGAEKEATLRRLRVQVEGLKAEIGAQSAERRQLRKLLGEERERLAALSESGALATSPAAAEEAAVIEPAGRPILPEYSDGFRKRLGSLAPAPAAKAILAAARFADIAMQTSVEPESTALYLPGICDLVDDDPVNRPAGRSGDAGDVTTCARSGRGRESLHTRI